VKGVQIEIKIVIVKLKTLNEKGENLRKKKKEINYSNNNKKYSQFCKSSVLITLASNPGTGTYD
jgi:hypothetical protein